MENIILHFPYNILSKARVHKNKSEIWINIKRELIGLKWVWNTTKKVDPPPPPQMRAPGW